MTTEHITWRNASDLPDSDLTVLCWGAEGFFCGYWDDGLQQWIACESGGSVLGVTHWCEPEGPGAAEKEVSMPSLFDFMEEEAA